MKTPTQNFPGAYTYTFAYIEWYGDDPNKYNTPGAIGPQTLSKDQCVNITRNDLRILMVENKATINAIDSMVILMNVQGTKKCSKIVLRYQKLESRASNYNHKYRIILRQNHPDIFRYIFIPVVGEDGDIYPMFIVNQKDESIINISSPDGEETCSLFMLIGVPYYLNYIKIKENKISNFSIHLMK